MQPARIAPPHITMHSHSHARAAADSAYSVHETEARIQRSRDRTHIRVGLLASLLLSAGYLVWTISPVYLTAYNIQDRCDDLARAPDSGRSRLVANATAVITSHGGPNDIEVVLVELAGTPPRQILRIEYLHWVELVGLWRVPFRFRHETDLGE